MLDVCEKEALIKETMQEHDGEHVRIKEVHYPDDVYGILGVMEHDPECYLLWIGSSYRRRYFHDVERFAFRTS
ncbi:MAG: hypothetical protein ABIA78_01035 [archaeon]